MFKRLLCLVSVFALVPWVHSQVQVELALRQNQFLLKETLEVGVRVVNHSGQTLELKGGDWLDLSVSDADRFLVNRIGPMPLPEDIKVESSYMATQWLDIGQTFDFQENGAYKVRARIRIKAWGREYSSEPVEFEIIRGTGIWSQKFGVPPKTPGDQPEFRTYILQQAIYLEEPQLYLRVTDESGQRVFAVERLAPLIQVSKPEAQIDTLSQLHVFTQVSVKDFAHIIVDPDGVIKQRHTYVAQGVRPSLKVSPSGGVYIAGGVRQLRKTDIPTPERFLARIPEPAFAVEPGAVPDPVVEPKPTEPEKRVADPFADVPPQPEGNADPFEKAEEELEKRTVGQP